MIDRALNFGPPVQQESYYFQLIPLNLSIINQESEVPAKGTTYRFTIFKAEQKFDQSKVPIEARFARDSDVPSLDIPPCKLNFYLPTFNKVRKHEFTLKLTQNQNNEDYDAGKYAISANALIAQFKESGKISHSVKAALSEDYQLEFQIYIEKTREALEKNVKELHKGRAIKQSPKVRERTITPKKKLEEVEVEIPSRDVEQFKIEAKVANKGSAPRQVRKLNQPLTTRAEDSEQKERQSQDRSEKNDIVSQKSGGSKVPLIQTKYKAVTKINAPSEIRLAESQRLSTITDTQVEFKKGGGEPQTKEKLFLYVFLAISAIFMYFAMHPNRKV